MTPLYHQFPNGLRAVVLPRPDLLSACVSVYVQAGSVHETRRVNGIGHVIEHMVFKGTTGRDARRINLDAEQLGAEVDAYTDKDHTAFHLRGLAEHASLFVTLLADLLLNATFPADELERERQVLLHEFADDADDPVSTAFKLFDTACHGSHALAQPVIGTRANLERFSRDDLATHLRTHYHAGNAVVVVAGAVDPQALLRAVGDAFGAMPGGAPAAVAPAEFVGGVRGKRLAGGGQLQLMLGAPLPALSTDLAQETRSRMAAAVLGEGMSSPLMAAVRERKPLAYYVACSADLLTPAGLFVLEASTSPQQAEALVAEAWPLLQVLAADVDTDELQRARHQLMVRLVRQAESLPRKMEEAALDLFFRGRWVSDTERRDELAAVSPEHVRQVFAGLVSGPWAGALVGPVSRSLVDRVRAVLPQAVG